MHTLVGYRLEMHGKYILQLQSYGELFILCILIHDTPRLKTFTKVTQEKQSETKIFQNKVYY